MFRQTLDKEKDHSEALYYLGYMHENGLGVDKDYNSSYHYYCKSVESSNFQNSKAVFRLANFIYSGLGGCYVNK